LLEETEKRRSQIKALMDWLMYGAYSEELRELDDEGF